MMATMEKKSAEVEAQASDSNGEVDVVQILGYKPELRRNRSMVTLLFQSLAIAAVGFALMVLGGADGDRYRLGLVDH